MNIRHVIESMDPKAGGPSLVMAHLVAEQQRLGLNPRVSFPESADAGAVDAFIRQAIGVNYLPAFQPVNGRKRFGRLTHDAMVLNELVAAADVLHCHGVWDLLILQTAKIAAKVRLPYIIRPAGMLEPWSMSQKRLKKQIAMALGYRAMLSDSHALHATSVMEAGHFRALGFQNPIALIPNGVDARVYEVAADRTEIEARWPKLRGKKWLLFLSRIHPKKGLFSLVQCWGELHSRFHDWHLLIAGPQADAGYAARVAAELQRSGASEHATFLGTVLGEQKTQVLLNSDLFVLPTHSENFGIAIAEAMAARLPVITTKAAPWSDIVRHRCGWWIDTCPTALLAALQDALGRTDDSRRDMGERARALIQTKFAWHVIGKATVDLYRWLLHGGEPPQFVIGLNQPVGMAISECQVESD